MIFDLSKMLQFHEAMKYLQRSGDKIIEIKEYKPKRSNPQNSYYWAILNFIAEQTGNTKDDEHDFFVDEFLSMQRFTIHGKEKNKRPSTRKLNKTEFNQYIEKISIFASTELGLIIPSPMDKDFDQFLKHYEKMIV